MINIDKEIIIENRIIENIDKEIYNTFLASSNNNEVFNILESIIELFFTKKIKINFISIGLPMDLRDIETAFNDCEVNYVANDEKKFIIRSYPELYITINKKNKIKKIKEYWTNSIPEERYIVIGNNDIVIANFADYPKNALYIIYSKKYNQYVEEILNKNI